MLTNLSFFLYELSFFSSGNINKEMETEKQGKKQIRTKENK
jgi:hypothetical protein